VLLGFIFICCAIAIFSYFLTYPRLRGPAIALAQTGFWSFTVTAPLVFGLAFFLQGRDLIAAAKVHAALYAAFTIVLGYKLGPLMADAVSLYYFMLLIELALLGTVVQRAPAIDRGLDSAPWLFVALTAALLAGSACGWLAWRMAVRADIVYELLMTGRGYQQ
jgi:hypothetical protein